MNRKLIFTAAVFALFSVYVMSCKEGVKKDPQAVDIQELTKSQPETRGPEIKESDVQITHPLNQEWVAAGKTIYELKCQPCHKLTEEKLVGPGWKGVTQRRTPVWILNMITNTDMMLDKDPEARKLLELCMVRMPNQNLMFDDARRVLEFQRNNDGEK
ncbi:MAG TPA: c-type cytochrome [Chitinophagaceae bacterium]|nr:c-type cytochrome [Chitinophagaceae bacterium]